MWFCNGPVSGPDAHGGARLDLLGHIESGRHLQWRAKVILVFFYRCTSLAACCVCINILSID